MFPLLFFIPFLLMSILFFSHMKKEPRGMQTGSKTKWYFTLNALIRECIGYLSISYRFHMIIILV